MSSHQIVKSKIHTIGWVPTSFPKGSNRHTTLLDLEKTLILITWIRGVILNEVQLSWRPCWQIIKTSSSAGDPLLGIHIVDLKWCGLRETHLIIYDKQGSQDGITVGGELKWSNPKILQDVNKALTQRQASTYSHDEVTEGKITLWRVFRSIVLAKQGRSTRKGDSILL